ncbi:MAG TPA: MFS transporter [Kofleriaceae bacterium]|nr:MFS transporter [Kofleriaceae bacterium]
MTPRDGLARLHGSLALLATRRFGTFWFATLTSNLGFWAQQVAEPWLLLDLGASPFVVGLDAFMLDAPQWLFTLIGGMLADHADRRRVIAGFQALQGLCPLALVVLVATGHVAPWMVIALALVVGVTDALSMPSYQSITPSIVEHDQIPTGLALGSIQFNLSRILGPALAGALLATIGVVGCFAANAASYVPFIAVAIWILPRGRSARTFDRRHPFAGIAGVLRDRRLRRPLATVLATGLFANPLMTFSPVLVRHAFGGTSTAFSVTIAAFGVGGLIGASALLASDPEGDHRARSSHLAIAFGVLVIAGALDPWLWALPAITCAAGIAMTCSNTLANTLVQQTASSEQRGQAVSMYMLAMRGGAALGSLATGVLAHAIGVRGALAVDGCLAVACQLIVARGV